jgi:hypothetical protein
MSIYHFPKQKAWVKKNAIIIDDNTVAIHPCPFAYQVKNARTGVNKVRRPHASIYALGKKPDTVMVIV